MKDLNTITEYQLLFLARETLKNRINDLKDEYIRSDSFTARRRIDNMLKRYTQQIAEINQRITEINNEGE